MMFGVRAKAHLHLAVVFVCIMKGKTDSAYTQFGCNFEDKEYKLKTSTSIWSEMHTPDDMEFSDPIMYHAFRYKVQNAIGKVMEKHSLNNVEQFIRFIQAYKNQNGTKKSLEDFFNDYHVPFQPLEDPVSFLIEINNELTTLHPNSKDRMYIVSAYVDPPEKIVKEVLENDSHYDQFNLYDKEKEANTELTKNQFRRHVAGIINVKYRVSDDIVYKGIIIVDPGYISGIEPVNPYSVLSLSHEKNHSIHRGEVLYPPGFNNELRSMMSNYMFNLVHLRNKFALTSPTPSLLEVQNPHKILYLRDKPFCSFMDSTTKGNLLAPHHGIMSFYRRGSPKGYLRFNVVPEYISNGSRPIFWLGTFNQTTKKDLGRSFTFDSIKPAEIRSDCRDEINKATEYLLLGPDYNLLGKLQTIQSEVFEDPDLVKDIYELNLKLNA